MNWLKAHRYLTVLGGSFLVAFTVGVAGVGLGYALIVWFGLSLIWWAQ